MSAELEKRRATGKWLVSGVPHRGWTCTNVTDLDEPSFTCEMCEVMVIRYVHTMEHPDYPEPLDCGCICAGNMEEDYAAAERREREMKNRSLRRARFPQLSGWRETRAGNETIKTRDGFRVVVFPHGAAWSGLVEDLETGIKRFAQKRYSSPVEVKLAAFTAMCRLAELRDEVPV
jgi:hypothetical protein